MTTRTDSLPLRPVQAGYSGPMVFRNPPDYEDKSGLPREHRVHSTPWERMYPTTTVDFRRSGRFPTVEGPPLTVTVKDSSGWRIVRTFAHSKDAKAWVSENGWLRETIRVLHQF